jgi:hypothetical protein
MTSHDPNEKGGGPNGPPPLFFWVKGSASPLLLDYFCSVLLVTIQEAQM